MRLAVFDLDGTLIGGASCERRFASWLLRHGVIGPRQMLLWAGFLASAWSRHGRHVPKKDKCYVAGLEVARVEALAGRFVDEELVARLDAAVVEEVNRHRARGDTLVLLSGTLQPLADALAARLGMARAIGSLAPAHGARYAFGPPLRHPFGEEKLALVEKLCANEGLALHAVVAYGDSFHDRALLERVGTPVAVEPDGRLTRLAEARRWRVLRHRSTLANPRLPVQPRRSGIRRDEPDVS